MTRNAERDVSRKRRRLPKATVNAVLLEAGYRCANPVCRHILTLESHHIRWVKDGGGNAPENLLALCPNCHSLHTYGHIPPPAILAWKSLLVSLNSPHRASADLLLVLSQEEERIATLADPSLGPAAFRFTGDSLPVVAGLLTARLVEISRRFSGASYFGGGMPSFELRLTDGGRRLVSAWKSGDPEAVRTALSASHSDT
jgi:hypothetical protein